jgi:hypothetical protein
MAENNATPNKRFQPREYQLELIEAAKKQNIIVCLGTGTGKTFISIKLIEYLARENDIFQPFSERAKRTFFLVNSGELHFGVDICHGRRFNPYRGPIGTFFAIASGLIGPKMYKHLQNPSA